MQLSPNISQLSPDDSVMTIAWVEGHPVSASCRVHSQAPLFLKTIDPNIQRQKFPLFGSMLWEEDGRIVRSDAELSSIQPYESGALIEVRGLRSEPLDRRRHKRVSVNASVSVKIVEDAGGHPAFTMVQGRLIDLSEGGAHIQISADLQEGTLLEFSAKSTLGELVQALGVVIKTRGESVGIAFFEPRATTQRNLARWIEDAA